MIPRSLTQAQVLDALQQIARDGVPRGRASRGYDLVFEGRSYPPKYVVALAIEAATGELPDPEAFGGGDETNTFLRGLGFTVVAKGEAVVAPRGASSPRSAAALPSAKPAPVPSTSGTTVKVGRVFLNLGVRMSEFPSTYPEKGQAFPRLTRAQFNQDPAAYRDRVRGLLQRAHAAGAEVVALPAGALIVGKGVTTASYGVSAIPWVIAGEAEAAERAVVMKHGVVTERFDAQEVRWLDAGRFTVLTAISSTIGKLIRDKRRQEPVVSKDSPPDPEKPILVVDVGHQQYLARYHFNTLRCVARDASRVGRPAALVLSSWMWSSKGIKCSWCQPEERVTVQTLTDPDEQDRLDLIEVDLSGHGSSRGRS